MDWNGPNQDCVIEDRGGIIENRHYVHAAVVDSDGKLLLSLGNPTRMTLLRSAAKPAQALAILETGAFQQFGFDDKDLALICASHNSEEFHISRARSMLKKVQAGEDDLRCGGHPAITPKVNNGWIRDGFTPTAIYNNCSGKYAGMLGGAKALGASLEGYNLLEHPMQQRVKQVVEDLSGLQEQDVKWVVDGCNLATPALSLNNMAQMYARFAAAADGQSVGGPNASRTQNCARIFNAMAYHSEYVAGTGRFCTALMSSSNGSMIGKIGADGCYGIGVRASEQTRQLGAKGAIGIAVKVEDGNLDMLYAAVPEILEQLGIGNADLRRELASFHLKDRKNTVGAVIGHVTYNFEIRPKKYEPKLNEAK